MSACAQPLRVTAGPMGPAGNDGTNGVNGINAFSTLLSAFTVPAIGANGTANVASTAWMVPGEAIFLQGGGVYYVASVTDSTHVVLTNPAAETGNVAAATVIPIASKLAPAGFKGAAGAAGGAGTGVTVATKGDIQTFAGAPANLPVGTNGQIPVCDSTAGTGLAHKSVLPNASASTDNHVAIFNTPLGTETPAPLQALATFKFTDTGAAQTVGGNARGVDAVDLSPARVANTQVASGNNSTIAGGRNNTSSGQGSAVGGGEGNIASGADSVVSGGANNTSSGLNAAIVGGTNNIGNGDNSFIAAGQTNVASGAASAVLSGSQNVASGVGAIAFGQLNTASATDCSALGGILNTANADGSTTIGGFQAKAYLYGQIAHSSGQFAAQGDAQTSELIWKGITTDATPTEIFIGPVGQRAVVPVNTTIAFEVICSARRSDGMSICFKVDGGITNTGGAVTLVAANTTIVTADGTGAVLGAANFVVSADNANDALKLSVIGQAAQVWRWVARARWVECGN